MELNDLLRKVGIDPRGVLILRHTPKEPKLNRVFPVLVNDRHDLFNAYQSTHGPRVEKMMVGATHIAAFHGHQPGKARFLGLYSMDGHRRLSAAEFVAMPTSIELSQYGEQHTDRGDVLCFELTLLNHYADWKGRLIVGWPGKEVVWHRWAAKNVLPVVAIAEHSQLVERVPHWKDVSLTWAELKLQHKSWESELSRWRGVYFIFDTVQAKGYVGSAGGEQNIWQRWSDHLKKGGDAKKLRRCDPHNFIFSILEITNHEMEPKDLVAIENSWKRRLNTIKHGLNHN